MVGVARPDRGLSERDLWSKRINWPPASARQSTMPHEGEPLHRKGKAGLHRKGGRVGELRMGKVTETILEIPLKDFLVRSLPHHRLPEMREVVEGQVLLRQCTPEVLLHDLVDEATVVGEEQRLLPQAEDVAQKELVPAGEEALDSGVTPGEVGDDVGILHRLRSEGEVIVLGVPLHGIPLNRLAGVGRAAGLGVVGRLKVKHGIVDVLDVLLPVVGRGDVAVQDSDPIPLMQVGRRQIGIADKAAKAGEVLLVFPGLLVLPTDGETNLFVAVRFPQAPHSTRLRKRRYESP